MPLLHKKPVELAKPPEPAADEAGPAMGWRIRFTGEMFLDYEYPLRRFVADLSVHSDSERSAASEYLARLDFYRQRIFSCASTGRKNLTFEEALLSEHEASLRSGKFPDVFLKPLATFIHHKQLPVMDLVDEFSEFLRTPVEGERVEFQHREGVVIKALPEDPSAKDKAVQVEIEVTPRPDAAAAPANTALVRLTVSVSELKCAFERKDRALLNKPLLKQKIREIADKNSYLHAPWIVHADLVQRFGLSVELPLELVFLEEQHQRKQRRGKSGAAKIADEDDVQDQSDSENSLDHPSEAKFTPKYPMEDSKVPRDDVLMPPKPTGAVNRDLPAPQSCIGQLFMIWNFCSAFAEVIALSLFSFEDLVWAIQANRRNSLLDEVHVAIIKTIFRGRQRSNIRKTSLSVKTWPDLLMEYLEEEADDLDHNRLFHKFKQQAYWSLTFDEKTTMLNWLVHRAIESDSVRAEIFKAEDAIDDLAKEQKEKIKAIRDKYKKMAEELDKARKAAKAGESPAPSPAAVPAAEKPEKSKPNKHPKESDGGSEDNEDDSGDESNDEDESSESSESEQEPPKTKVEIQHRLEAKLKKLHDEFEDRANPPTIRILPLGSDRYHNRYWWFGRRRAAVFGAPGRRRRGTPKLNQSECRIFVEYYPGNVKNSRPEQPADRKKILRDPKVDEYISTDTEADSSGDELSPWATPSANLFTATSSKPASSSTGRAQDTSRSRGQRAERRTNAKFASDEESDSESDSSSDESSSASGSDSESASGSGSESSSSEQLPAQRRARPKSLKEQDDDSEDGAESGASDFDEDDEEPSDRPRRSTRGRSRGDYDEEDDDEDYGVGRRSLRARPMRQTTRTVDYNPRPVGERQSLRLVAKATLPGGSLFKDAKNKSKDSKKDKKKDKGRKKNKKREKKRKRQSEKDDQASEASSSKPQTEKTEPQSEPEAPVVKKAKIEEPNPEINASSAASQDEDAMDVDPPKTHSRSRTKQRNEKAKEDAQKKETEKDKDGENENEEEEEDAESSVQVVKPPRWKPDFTLFNEQTMPEKVDCLWAFYDTPEQVQQLIDFLDERGIRERQLRRELLKRQPRIVHFMQKFVNANRNTPLIPDGGRRSTRITTGSSSSSSAASQSSLGVLENFDVYVNRLAKDK